MRQNGKFSTVKIQFENRPLIDSQEAGIILSYLRVSAIAGI
jgi:hypothetical protein